jgi:2,3-bisphosphoglycerate-dependent phosphoglycerate mutase
MGLDRESREVYTYSPNCPYHLLDSTENPEYTEEMETAHKIVFIRHGLTSWARKFTGWIDVDVLPEGLTEARKYVPRLKNAGITFDLCYTSMLKRAIKTALAVLEDLDRMWIPHIKHWRLNERHYGAIQGMDKRAAVEKYGEEQVNEWRRGYDTPPPALDASDPTHPSHDVKYAGVNRSDLPNAESLSMVRERVRPYYKDEILPMVIAGKRVLISGNHNSMRALVMEIKGMSPQEIIGYNIPYSIPLVMELDKAGSYIRDYYLASDEEVREVVNRIKNQTK